MAVYQPAGIHLIMRTFARIEKTTLHDALLWAINQVLEQDELIEADVEQSLAKPIAKQESADDEAMLENRLSKLDEDFMLQGMRKNKIRSSSG